MAILTGLVTFGATLLLIIPGIILSVYLTLTNFVFVNENKTGASALSRSLGLIKGHWWSVLGRFFVVGFLLSLVFLLVGGSFAILIELLNLGEMQDFIFGAISQVFSAFITLINLYVGNEIYRGLKSVNHDVRGNNKAVWTILALLGSLLIGGIIYFGVMVVMNGDNPDSVFYIEDVEEVTSAELNLDAKNRALELRGEAIGE